MSTPALWVVGDGGPGFTEEEIEDFPGGAVDENPPTNAGDMGLILGLGRFHVLRSNSARVPQLPSRCAARTEALVPRARALQQEEPLQ